MKIDITADQVQQLINGGKMSFQLSISDKQLSAGGKPVLAEVYIDKIEVGFYVKNLLGLKRAQDYPFVLEHSGHHRFRTQSGKVLDFVSPVRAVSSGNSGLIQDFTNASNLAPSEFVGVSPFTTWTVKMTSPPEELKHLKQLQVTLYGSAYPIDDVGAKMWQAVKV
jgi:hypothetical protein